MIDVIFSLPLIALVIAVGVFLPWLGLHLELLARREQRSALALAARTRIIEDQQATINAYRELVSNDATFTLTSQ